MVSAKEEWDVDINDPASIHMDLAGASPPGDIFTFIQRLPESRPKFDYPMEWDNVAAIPVRNYEWWLEKQINQEARNKIRKALKKEVEVKIAPFNDDFIEGVRRIYNESPIRQGKPYWNYGMDLETTRQENSSFLERSEFLAAYYKEELIGYLKLTSTDRFARTMGILAMIRHRERSPMNLLIAKAVERCAERKIPYLVYAKFNYSKVGSSTLIDFKKSNGFESIMIPRYFIPLTTAGHVALKTNLHKGIVGVLPENVTRMLLKVRKYTNERKRRLG